MLISNVTLKSIHLIIDRLVIIQRIPAIPCIVPIGASALASVKLVKNATLKIYPGAPHGLADTHKDQLNADLLDFLRD
jgi:pimeloyl-ACP methyl ester carboxylesterase